MQELIENRSGGNEPPNHCLVPCTACKREIPRGALTCLYCGHHGPAWGVPRTAKKRHNPAKFGFGALIMLAGFISLFYFIPFPMNLIVGFTALILGFAAARALQCDRCGARVDRQSVDCPRCGLPFALL
jgi:hypothetical protein